MTGYFVLLSSLVLLRYQEPLGQSGESHRLHHSPVRDLMPIWNAVDSLTTVPRWFESSAHHDHITSPQGWDRDLTDTMNRSPVVTPSISIDSVIPSARRTATNVVHFRYPCGTEHTIRVPRHWGRTGGPCS